MHESEPARKDHNSQARHHPTAYDAIMLARLVSLELQPGGTAERSTTDGLEGAANNGVVPARRVISVDRPVHLPVDGGGVPA